MKLTRGQEHGTCRPPLKIPLYQGQATRPAPLVPRWGYDDDGSSVNASTGTWAFAAGDSLMTGDPG